MSASERSAGLDPTLRPLDGPTSRPVWEGVVDSLGEAVIAADPTNTIIYVNESTEALLGWSADDLIGSPLTKIIPARFRGAHLDGFARFVATGEGSMVGVPVRLPALRNDGTEASVELMISRVRLGSQLIVVGLLRDAAERIDLEGVSEASDRLLAVLAESPDLEAALPEVLRSLGESLHWDLAQLWQVGEDALLRCRSRWGTPDALATPHFTDASEGTFAHGEGLPGRVWKAKEPEWVRDVRTAADFERSAAAQASGLCTAFAFPLMAGEQCTGVIELLSLTGRDRSDELTERLRALGQRIGWYLERRAAEDKRRVLLQQLTFQAALLEAQTEAGLEGQLIVSPSGEMISFNRRFAELWGITDAVLGRRSDAEALAGAANQVVDPSAFLARVQEAYATGRPTRDEITMRDGRVIDRAGVPLRHEGTNLGYAWYFRDVSEAKHLQRELSEAGERFAALARTLQQSLLPPQLPEIAGVEVAARYHPAGSGDEVGGDFYDLFRVGRSWGFVVGDVCGKGAEAAVVTALVRYTIRAAAHQARSPAKALAIVNDAMLSQAADGGSDRFATAVHGRLRAHQGWVDVTVACAGHPMPILRRANGEVEQVGRLGTLLGVMPTVSVHDRTVRLLPGDVLIVVTDGVLEARRDAEQFGDHAMEEIVRSTPGTAADLARAIETASLAHQGGVAADDIAILAIGLT